MVSESGTSFEERVGRVLQDAGFISADQLEQARDTSLEQGTGLFDTLVSLEIVARETLMTVLSFQLRIPVVDLMRVQVDPEAVKLVPEEFALEHSVLPIGFEADGSLRIATMVPNDFQLASQLSSITGRQTKFALALSGGLDELIQRTYSSGPARQAPEEPAAEPAAATGVAIAPAEAPTSVGLLGEDVSQLPAVQAVEMVTLQAVKRRASDVHLVPTADSSNVLFRLDGTLQQTVMLPLRLHESMVARIKVLAEMDISETRRPQDGSFTLQFGEKSVDFRVSTIGITWGEMMVVRILDRSGGLFTLQQLGLTDTALLKWRQLLSLPYGMVLVSGPTGSGKTTTLYASVMELVKDRGNIMTVEDPIEYRVEELHQIQVNRAAGIDFPTGLKSIMRLDPDIILVGEIRDGETAKTAIDAALTGHLVLASIHSNDAASSLVRLLDLGIEPYMVATGVVGALGQRLVRKMCPHCKTRADLGAAEEMAYESEMQEPADQAFKGQGCNFCGFTGYLGRSGVFEVLTVGDDIRRLIASGVSGQDIRAQAVSDGMMPMRRAGMLMAKEGITTVEEVLRKVFFVD
jgi:type II secretory ATPase GspE/PulE/Tfp pilus assembly ATPase PilB-like protein